jgi:oxidase EvaA
MSTRSVLSCLPAARQGTALHTDTEVRAWMNDRRGRYRLATHHIALAKVAGWRVTADEVAAVDGTGFRVIGLRVRATGREVQQWSQPVVAPCRPGLAAAVTRRINGVDHVLMHARVDAGHRDVVELGPTVTYSVGAATPPFLSEVLAAPAHRVLFDTLLSEEGGRLYHAVNRYLIVEADDDFAPALPEDYRWLSLAQLSRLLEHGDNVNVSARSLVTCLRSCR